MGAGWFHSFEFAGSPLSPLIRTASSVTEVIMVVTRPTLVVANSVKGPPFRL